MKKTMLILTAAAFLAGCKNTPKSDEPEMEASGLSVSKAPFGNTPDGPADLYTLRNKNGLEVAVTNFGATIVKVLTPDRTGAMEDIVLGFDSVDGYVGDNPYFGAVVGRYGNRIAKGKFSLDGQEYTLATNNEPNHLHGGVKGFNKVLWTAEPVESDSFTGVKLHYLSKDMEEGYPGNLDVTMTYSLNNDNELLMEYAATTDKKTVCNLTNHAYFNLTGGVRDSILRHQLKINASRYTPVDATLIPTGELAPVEGTPFDFRRITAIGQRIGEDNEQLRRGLGYDHNFVLDRQGAGMELAASVYDPFSGRILEVWTVEPGVQFYSGNFLDGSITGKGGKVYTHRTGLCLETQHFPDSPNHPDFPGTTLAPGQKYYTKTIYRFDVKSDQ
ncbi:MAG: galactose mutarotase [Lewinellaceae bacterium]|nr:galactose mutarotase [Lewinellaceae bacterium]